MAMNLRRRMGGGALSKMIVAIINPFKFESVKGALGKLGIETVTVGEVKSFCATKPQKGVYRGIEYTAYSGTKLKIEILVPSHQASKVLAALSTCASDGDKGDERVFVSDVEEIVRIHGVEGSDAM
jgi:nitrogen regulatory protein PII